MREMKNKSIYTALIRRIQIESAENPLLYVFITCKQYRIKILLEKLHHRESSWTKISSTRKKIKSNSQSQVKLKSIP